MKKNKKSSDGLGGLSHQELIDRLLDTQERVQVLTDALHEEQKLRTTWCMSIDEFIETFTTGLKDHLVRGQGTYFHKLHPEDLASNALTYAEVFFAVYENTDWRKVTGTSESTNVA